MTDNNILPYDNIPLELKERKQWVVWRFEETKDGNVTKVPYQSERKYKASSTNPNHWSSFEEARDKVIASKRFYNGIGYVFSKDDPYTGIDIDNLIIDGEIAEEAQLIIDTLDSYTEYSQSGAGAHIIVKGKLPFGKGRKTKDKKYEVYDHSRYFVFTGNIIGKNREIEERQKELEAISRHLFPEVEDQGPGNEDERVGYLELSDDVIIEKLEKAKNNDKFKALYYQGDTTAYGNDDSAADLALCNLIAFYTNDFEQMDRIFSSSKLYRPKWDRQDYKEMTIGKALEGNSKYDPSYNKSSAEDDFEAVDQDHEDFESRFLSRGPRAFISVNEKTGARRVNVPLLTLYTRLKHDIRFYNGTFRLYTNGYYSLVEDIKRLVYAELPDDLKDYKHCKNVEDNLSIESRILLKDYELAGARYISFNNGVLDLKTMKLKDHDKELPFVNQIPHNYNPHPTRCEYTEAFFKNACGDSQELKNFLIQIIGVTISELRGFKNWFFISGKKDTGKSTYLKIIQELLTNDTGEKQYSSIPLSSLQNTESMEIWPIFGKKANIVAETPPEPIRDDTVLKTLTSGGDTLRANKKFSDPIEGIPRAILLFAGNNIPLIWNRGDKNALVERLLIYNFKHQVPKEKQIVNIEKKINYEYLIKLALDQLIVFIKNKQRFNIPQEVLDMQQQILMESDDVYNFIHSNITDGLNRISYKKLYAVYKYWCYEVQGITSSFDNNPLTQNRFNKEARKHLGNKVGEKLHYEDSNKKENGFININIDPDLLKQCDKYLKGIGIYQDKWRYREFS